MSDESRLPALLLTPRTSPCHLCPRTELQKTDPAMGLELKMGLSQGYPFLSFSSSGCPTLPWCLARSRREATRQGSEELIDHPMGTVCEQKFTGMSWLWIIKMEQKGPEIGTVSGRSLRAGVAWWLVGRMRQVGKLRPWPNSLSQSYTLPVTASPTLLSLPHPTLASSIPPSQC